MRTEINFANNLDYPLSPLPYSIQSSKKRFANHNYNYINKPLPSNIEVNNVSNFIAYCVGHHGVLLASEDFFNLWNFLQKNKI
jgi:hypothetical protein